MDISGINISYPCKYGIDTNEYFWLKWDRCK